MENFRETIKKTGITIAILVGCALVAMLAALLLDISFKGKEGGMNYAVNLFAMQNIAFGMGIGIIFSAGNHAKNMFHLLLVAIAYIICLLIATDHFTQMPLITGLTIHPKNLIFALSYIVPTIFAGIQAEKI